MRKIWITFPAVISQKQRWHLSHKKSSNSWIIRIYWQRGVLWAQRWAQVNLHFTQRGHNKDVSLKNEPKNRLEKRNDTCTANAPLYARHTINMDRNWRCVLFTFCFTTTNYIVHISQTGWSNRLLPTFWAQSVTFGALPDSTLVHLICVTTACPHTCSVISHNIVTCDNCTRQVYDKYVIFSIHRLNIWTCMSQM